MIIGLPILKLMTNFWIAIIEICAVVAIFIIVERWRSLRRVKFDTNKFTQDIRAAIKKGGSKKAIQICEVETHPLARVIKAGLMNAALSREDVYDAIDEAKLMERGVLETRIGMLTTLAFISPLLGLLGTVVGIIQAFSAMAAAGGADPTAMLSGIAIALLTTALGIIVAVPSAIFFGVFSGRVDSICSEMERGGKDLILALSEHVWTPSRYESKPRYESKK